MKYLDYKEHRKQGTFSFPIAFYHIEPSHPRYLMPYHWHTEYEIMRIIKGSFEMTINGQIFQFSADDIIFIYDGLLHGGTPHDCIYECIVFDMNILLRDNHICSKQIQKLLAHEILIYQVLPKDIVGMQAIINNLFESMHEKRTGYEFITHGSLYLFLGLILENKLYSENTEFSSSTPHLAPLKNVLSYLEKHYMDEISLNHLANIAGMNPRYFCRYFKTLTNRPPIDYLNYYRIECAREQLSTTSLSITDVAFNCGFNEVSYFIRTFKKYLGVTPKQYLKSNYSS
ncbi:MAG: AraC family transcriptional regulator [Eubacteriales bacterium]